MALLLAYDRWQDPDVDTAMAAAADAGAPAVVDYQAGAWDLLTVMRHKVDQNGGTVGGVTDVFDPVTALVFDSPDVSSANVTSPSIELPGFYDLWAQATGDAFWNRAATAGRDYWQKAAGDRTNGLVPAKSDFAGTPVANSDTFSVEAYRSLVNFVVDQTWTPGSPVDPAATPWDVAEADRLLRFFIGMGISTYGREFSLDGTTVDTARDNALVAANGITGLISTVTKRSDFIQAVWDMDIATGNSRYFTGTMQMIGLLLLSGQFQVY